MDTSAYDKKSASILSDCDIASDLNGDGKPLPIVIQPHRSNLDAVGWCKENKRALLDILYDFGAILLRGFEVNVRSFEAIASALSHDLLEYTERSSPREHIQGRVYTSTEYPSNKEIFLHNEQSYNLNYPTKIFFCCLQPATIGGLTPLADTRKVFERVIGLGPEVDELRLQGYRLNRHYRPRLGLDWKYVFQTTEREKVEQYCEKNNIQYAWGKDESLSTSQIRQCVVKHPTSGATCWFNHCTFFNINCLDNEIREMLLSACSENELPNNTYLHSGKPISSTTIANLKMCYEKERKEFIWQKNDILFADNILASHGRTMFHGNRQLLTILSDSCRWNTSPHQNAL